MNTASQGREITRRSALTRFAVGLASIPLGIPARGRQIDYTRYRFQTRPELQSWVVESLGHRVSIEW